MEQSTSREGKHHHESVQELACCRQRDCKSLIVTLKKVGRVGEHQVRSRKPKTVTLLTACNLRLRVDGFARKRKTVTLLTACNLRLRVDGFRLLFRCLVQTSHRL
eukprot:2084616-Rhodomonas_salina.1